jgi:hypothetical protein
MRQRKRIGENAFEYDCDKEKIEMGQMKERLSRAITHGRNPCLAITYSP